jgi:hypothetical protein
MIYVLTALPAEAKPLIQRWNLKKEEGRLQVFSNAQIRLAVTGTGPLSAAAVTGALLSPLTKPHDFLINAGICAGSEEYPCGTAVLIHKLTDLCGGREYYPDLIYTSLNREASLITVPSVYTGTLSSGTVYDMEGAAVFHAGSMFLSPHQMRFVKVISDHGNSFPSPEEVSSLMEGILPVIEEEIQAMEQQCPKEEPALLEEEIPWEDFRASVTMKRQLHQLLTYAALCKTDWQSLLEQYRREGKLPVRSREEGKQRMEELRHELID